MPEYRLDNFEILTANSSQNIEKNLKIVWLNFDLPKSTPKKPYALQNCWSTQPTNIPTKSSSNAPEKQQSPPLVFPLSFPTRINLNSWDSTSHVCTIFSLCAGLGSAKTPLNRSSLSQLKYSSKMQQNTQTSLSEFLPAKAPLRDVEITTRPLLTASSRNTHDLETMDTTVGNHNEKFHRKNVDEPL